MSNIPAILHLFVMGGGAVLAGVWVMDGDRCWDHNPDNESSAQLSYRQSQAVRKQMENRVKCKWNCVVIILNI